MTTVTHLFGKAIPLAVMVMLTTAANAATVGTGPAVIFSKADGTEADLAENQDRITPLVWLTRGNVQGLFNIAQEEAYQQLPANQGISPEGTLWAFADLNGNPVNVSAEDFGSLNFDDWTSALSSQVGLNIVDRPGVVHLVDEDMYLDIVFTEWTRGPGGGFAYVRSGIIPIPAAAWLFGSALGLLGWLKRRTA